MKTVHTTFTTAGYRSNYKNEYNLHLTLDDSNIPIDPYPVFLGIKIDPKLNYREHLSNIKTKLMAKVKMLQKIKAIKLKNQIKLCKIIFNSLIRSTLDYSHVILNTDKKILFYLENLGKSKRILTLTESPSNHFKSSSSYFEDFTIIHQCFSNEEDFTSVDQHTIEIKNLSAQFCNKI
ncbi:hypothetical protein BpHYR1_050097 [Brachionus plicatilis]|uniref:RNA-directed DNA polymerase from mobile element jockey-like n=1 Tax=Brachionus plicatilis TaxID=10195 RepID=A0A3M7PGH7_BRAPC|nr:hypothetical protein BpHYR1_050097 [Brachionus plicatilis]